MKDKFVRERQKGKVDYICSKKNGRFWNIMEILRTIKQTVNQKQKNKKMNMRIKKPFSKVRGKMECQKEDG